MAREPSSAERPPLLYRQLPLLSKPGRRSPARALPSALHCAVPATAAQLVFAIIDIVVSDSLGPRSKWTKLVQAGTLMAMITVSVLALPNLGSSITKGVQRILGVMAGGWLFYGLFTATQEWWVLAPCLALWAFLLVSVSFVASGSAQFLCPTALVTAFIVAVQFDSAQQALIMTTVKTVAITGAIVVHTLASLALFPLTATQQLMEALGDSLASLQSLAGILLLYGEAAPAGGAASATLAGPAAKDAAEAAPPSQAGAAAGQGAAAEGEAARLVADAAHKLQLVQRLLPAARKERYMGSCVAYRCFLPSVAKPGTLQESAVLAVVLHASQVLRVQVAWLTEFGAAVPLVRRPPPASHVSSDAAPLLRLLAEHEVAALQELATALPPSGAPSSKVSVASITSMAGSLRQLVAATIGTSAAAAAPAQAAATADAAPPAANRWQHAAASAAPRLKLGGASGRVASAFAALLADAATSDESRLARWCSALVLLQQLGRATAALTDSINGLLPQLPWPHAAAAAHSGDTQPLPSAAAAV